MIFNETNSGSLTHVLRLIAEQIKCDPQVLIGYAHEDNLGGFHMLDSLRLWPMGSMWGVEGQILYALIRHFKPENIVEVGGWTGCSASHMASACKANGKGHVISVDNGVGGQAHGYMIPDYLRELITLINEDGRIFLAHQTPNSIDFMLEDADHSTPLVLELSRLALAKIKAGGILVSHDAMHDYFYDGNSFTNGAFNGNKNAAPEGQRVREGLAQAGVYFSAYLAEPSDCGVAIAVMPGVQVDKLGQPYDKARMKAFADEANPYIPNSESTEYSNPTEESINNKAAEAQAEYVGSANIESLSTPPEPLQAQEKQKTARLSTPEDFIPESWIMSAKETPEKPKPRSKGKRKPKAQ